MRASIVWIAVICAFLAIGSPISAQQANASKEYKVKVAYLHHFTRYFSWNADAFQNSPQFVIGVLGKDPFGRSLEVLQARKKAAGRTIEIRRFANVSEYRHCHILFVSRETSRKDRADLLRATRSAQVLVVGEVPNYATEGAGLNFFNDRNGTVGFEVNVDAVKRAGLRIDAKLLEIARVVRDGGA